MVGVLFGLYAVLSYLLFFVTFLYAIAFTDNLPLVPKTIDSGTPGGLVPSLAINALLLGVFAIQHSVMARPAFKAWWTKFVPPPIERSTYVLFATLALILLLACWQPMPAVIWDVSGGPIGMALLALSLIGFGIVLASTFLLSHFELFGLAQVYARMRRQALPAPEFHTPLFYKLVRHPLYLGFAIAFWATPKMTLGHLVFAVATLGYMLIAIQLEERDLIGLFGERYIAYRKQVGMLLPKLGGGAKEAG